MTQPPDLGRRGFFRTFAKDVVRTTGVALETVTTLNRAAAEAAGSILRASAGEAPSAAAEPAADAAGPAGQHAPGATEGGPVVESATAGSAGLPRPFRVDGDVLFVVDERHLPGQVVEIECHSPIDVAREIAGRTLPGGSVPGQAAAMSLALAASEMRGYLPTVRTAILRIRADGLINARPSSQHLRAAVARVMAVYDAAVETDADGTAIAAAMREEAEATCREADVAIGLIGEHLITLLANTGPRPVAVLTDATGVPFLTAAARARDVAVHVLEGGPERRGARIGSTSLVEAGVEHAVTPDAAAGWLLATGRVDGVVVGAERIAANGDVINDIGTYPLAILAERHDVPLYVCGPVAAMDIEAADGAAASTPEGGATESAATDSTEGVAARPAPRDEATPHDLIAAIVTERGVLRPPFEESLPRP